MIEIETCLEGFSFKIQVEPKLTVILMILIQQSYGRTSE